MRLYVICMTIFFAVIYIWAAVVVVCGVIKIIEWLHKLKLL